MYSKSAEVRTAFVRSAFEDLRSAGVNKMACLAPKKFLPGLAGLLPEAVLYAYEDVPRSNELFNRADDKTLLVFDRASRYKNITNDLFVRLSRLATKYQHKLLVDIVPFTADVQFLYCPLAFIDRGVLGYQHWYSFRENNLEETVEGPVRAFDYHLLARKLAPNAGIDYEEFVGSQVQTIDCQLTAGEASEYQILRDRLFAENKTASPIITALADWTNIRPDRYAKLREILSGLTGRTVCYTNLGGHNQRLRKAIPGIEAKSFYDANGDEDQFDNIILFEAPIVRGYLFLDVLANVRSDCKIFFFRANTTVDKLLYNRMHGEYVALNEFSRVLYREVHRERRS